MVLHGLTVVIFHFAVVPMVSVPRVNPTGYSLGRSVTVVMDLGLFLSFTSTTGQVMVAPGWSRGTRPAPLDGAIFVVVWLNALSRAANNNDEAQNHLS